MRKLAALIVLALTLTGCGFQPLYGEFGRTPGLQNEIGQVQINVANTRLGATMYNELADLLHPAGPPNDPKYALNMDLNVVRNRSGFQIDRSVTRADIRITADYRLVDLSSNKTILVRKRTSNVAHDIQDSQFANLVSEEDAEKRASRMLSEHIQLDLALFFKNNRDAEVEEVVEDPAAAEPIIDEDVFREQTL